VNLELLRSIERTMPVPPNPEAFLSLRIWHCKFKSLAPIAAFVRLEKLTVATYPDATLDALAGLEHLRHLALLHFPKVADLAPLAHLKKLETLSLATLPSWDASRRRIEVQSLEPLAKLPALRAIELFGVVNPDRTLATLAKSRTIKTARFSGYPKKEVCEFYALTGASSDFNTTSDA
jgi:hypothetical protein